MSDLIDRQAAIEAFQMFRKYDSNRNNSEWIDRIETVLKNQPTFDTDISEYSDRLWKLAYERGQKEGVVCCRDCKNWDRSWKSTSPDHHYCPFIDWPTSESFYCAKAERRPDDPRHLHP